MSADSNMLADFKNRYVAESIAGDEGVLVDLKTGCYFKLNATALVICEALQETTGFGDAIDRIAERLKVPSSEATRLTEIVSTGLSEGLIPKEAPGPLRYISRVDGSATFAESGRSIFFIAPGSRLVQFRASLDELNGPLILYLQALVPKLLVLLDIPVLHAAACRIGSSLLALSGKSGAGKTTTALAFEQAGAQLISEDLLILSPIGESPSVYLGGERLARDWARAVAPEVERAPDRQIDFSPLADAQQGATAPLMSMWFVDVNRRVGNDIQIRTLSAADGALALLTNGLLATTQAGHWRNLLERSLFLARRTSLSEATMPDGLDHLREAARRYIVNSAS